MVLSRAKRNGEWGLISVPNFSVHISSKYGRRLFSPNTQTTMKMDGTDLITFKYFSVTSTR